ncbi:MAG: sulfatase [Armatimonadota bacterium]
MKSAARRLVPFLFALAAAVVVGFSRTPASAAPRYNVLFITVDDLRPQLGSYGDPLAKTPNIDRLAKEGLLFERAYVQQAVCSPSRTSVLTGRRPDTTRVYDLQTHFRKALPDVVTLPQHFKSQGYFTQAVGKVYHPGVDDEKSWSAPTLPRGGRQFGPEGQKVLTRQRDELRKAGRDPDRARGLPWEAPEVEDDYLNDGSIARQAVETLERLRDRPFFLAVGFLKPHLPFVAPKKYWDLHRPEQMQPAANDQAPDGAPAYAVHNSGELRAYYGIPAQGPLSDAQARKMVHGYYASVSYMDAQVGRVLQALDRLKLRERTVVVLWGDHGWQLGEHGMWCKHTNYETSTRAPLLLSVPGQETAGSRTRALVEMVDIYPSLVEACGLPRQAGMEGTSFLPLLRNPDRAWKKGAISQYPRSPRGVGELMGYTVRTDRYRLVEWANADRTHVRHELYDHESDPGENVNVAGKPEYAETLQELRALLNGGWKACLPVAASSEGAGVVVHAERGR